MTEFVSDIAFTPTVKAEQTRHGSRDAYARMEQKRGWQDSVTDDLAAFIAERDSFYLATVSADGQPYIQHRGGKPGFLKVLDEKTLAFAEYAGNRQYITLGNLRENAKAYIFLMDYANRHRIKIWGRARAVEDDAALIERVSDPDDPVPPARIIVFEIAAWDRNCPQFITPRYTQSQFDEVVEPLKARIAELESERAANLPFIKEEIQ